MRPFETVIILLCSLAISFICAAAQHGFQQHNNDTQYVCVPFGSCEPCPEDARKEPFCQPFGNRRLVHCVPMTSSLSSSPAADSHAHPPQHHPRPAPPSSNPYTHSPNPHDASTSTNSPIHTTADPHQGEIPAWESCGRIVEKERGDFYEFLACNFIIALVAIGIVLARSKQLQTMQARNLAARIGLVRGVPGGWMNG